MAVNLDALAIELKENEGVAADEWDATNEDRGDQGLDADFVPRETPAPEAPKEPEQSEEEVAADLGKEPEAKAEPEVEPEVEPEPEAKAEPEVEPEVEPEPEVKKPHTVPQVRLTKEIERRKAIEAENVRLRQEAEANQVDVNKAAEEIQDQMRKLVSSEHEAILQGDTDKANDLRNQHSDLQLALMKQSMAEVQQAATQITKEEMAFDATVAELQVSYPIFDPDSETFNNDLLQDVLRDRDAFYNAGTPLADALRRAVSITVALNGLNSVIEKEEVEDDPGEPKVANGKEEEAALKKKLDAAKKQPPTLRGETTSAHGEQALNIEDMTEEDFEALPDATIRRMRGD